MKKVSKDLTDKFEYRLLGIMTLLSIIGILAIYSSTKTSPAEQGNFIKQIYSWFASVAVMMVIVFIPTRFIKNLTIPFYAFSIILLIAVLVVGKVTNGAKCWIHIGSYGFQPSELAKISVVLALAQFLSALN